MYDYNMQMRILQIGQWTPICDIMQKEEVCVSRSDVISDFTTLLRIYICWSLGHIKCLSQNYSHLQHVQELYRQTSFLWASSNLSVTTTSNCFFFTSGFCCHVCADFEGDKRDVQIMFNLYMSIYIIIMGANEEMMFWYFVEVTKQTFILTIHLILLSGPPLLSLCWTSWVPVFNLFLSMHKLINMYMLVQTQKQRQTNNGPLFWDRIQRIKSVFCNVL